MSQSTNWYSGPLFIIIAAALWAFDGLIRQHLYTLPPLTIIFFEHLVGLIILTPFVLRHVLTTKLTHREWWLVVLVAILSGFLGTLWFTTALGKVHFISISVVFLLQKLQPLFAISTARIFLKEKLDERYYKWAFISILAAYFVTFPSGVPNLQTGSETIIAALFALGAAIAWGSSTTFSKMLLNKVDFKVSTFYRFLFTTIFALPILYFFGGGFGSGFIIPSMSQFQLLILIAVSTGMVALLIYYKGLSKTPVHVSTILELTFPFIAIFIDMKVNHTVLSHSQWLAAIILVFCIFQISRIREKNEQQS